MNISSDSLSSPAPRTPKPPPEITVSPRSPRRPREFQQLDRNKKEQKIAGTSRDTKKLDAPFSLRMQIFQVLAMAIVAWIVATVGFKTVEWIQQQLRPFCDSYSTTKVERSDECIPCPDNGSCRDGVLECFAGFRRVGKSCFEDKAIHRTAEKVMGYLANYLCKAAARAVCDGASGGVRLTDDEAQTYLKEQGLLEQLKFDDKSWLLVLEKMAVTGGSIAILNDLEGKREFICRSEFVQGYKAVRCRIREWILANLVIFVVVSPMVVLGASFTNRCLKRRKITARAEEVYRQICEVLEERALESREQEPWVVVSRLRDHLLLPSERKATALWSKIEDITREDSRIDQYQKKVKGEMKIVWEWQVEGALKTSNGKNKVVRNSAKPIPIIQ